MAEARNYFDLDAEEMGSIGTAIDNAVNRFVARVGDRTCAIELNGEPAFAHVDFKRGCVTYDLSFKSDIADAVAVMDSGREVIVGEIKSACPFIGKVEFSNLNSVVHVECFIDESLSNWEAPERERYQDMDMAFVAERAAAANEEGAGRAMEVLRYFVVGLRGDNQEFEDLMRHFERERGEGVPVMVPDVFLGGSGGADGDRISFHITFRTKHLDIQRLIKEGLSGVGFTVHNEGDGTFVLDVPNEVFKSGLSAYLTRRKVVAGAAEAVGEGI